MPELNLNPEAEKLGNYLEKYIEATKEKVSHYDESKSGERKKLEEKIEKAQSYLDKIRVPESRNFIDLEPVCERYSFRYGDDNKSVTLDITQELNDKLKLNPEEKFYVAEEVLERKETEGAITIESESEIFLQSHLIEEETNTGKIAGAFVPAAATIGAVAGGLGGGATGLAVGSITDKLSNAEKAKIKEEIKGFLKDYKTIMEEKSRDCQKKINQKASTAEEKEESQKQKEHYDNEVKEMKAYIENNNNWK
ncbi:29278_t:CDS:2 [Gigaspora margarita]|uniref:29278_t:CDS:1 n=1 Tax=Gigaspora margarita TaxID=4874 RepID=A0ABM8W122_GIGMA|nr:29278_t:CDS:2 [Gigaspora margarita]